MPASKPEFMSTYLILSDWEIFHLELSLKSWIQSGHDFETCHHLHRLLKKIRVLSPRDYSPDLTGEDETRYA